MGDTPNIQIPIRNIDNNTDTDNNSNTDNNTNNTQDNSSFNEETYNYAGSSYIKLPPSLINKRATVNPQNNDNYCFKWAILAKHV